MAPPCVLFRVDASSIMGMGHLMRCRAIAEAVVESGGMAIFAMVEPLTAAVAMMDAIPAQLVRLPGPPNSKADLEGLQHWMGVHQPAITVVDGYHFSDAYLRAVSQVGPLAVLWDAADREAVAADVVIDASSHAPTRAYAQIAPQALQLTGPRHALIRRDIRQATHETHLALAQRNHVLVSFGGADPLNLSMAVLPELVKRLPRDVDITVLAGAAYPHARELQNLAAQLVTFSRIRVSIHPPSVAPFFCAAGLVVTAAGGTIGELVALSLPALSVVVAQNQVAANADGPYPCLDGRAPGAAVEIAERATEMWLNLPERERVARGLRGVVDGEGAMRVAKTLLSTHFKKRLQS